MKQILSYIGQEALLGAKDNVEGLKQMVFHPIQFVKSFASALRHPINTLKGMGHSFASSPIRFSTNIVLSIAEGRLVSWSLQKISGTNIPNTSTTGQPADLICQLDNFTFANASTPLPEVSGGAPPSLLHYLPTTRKPIYSGNLCTVPGCGIPAAPTAPSVTSPACFIDFSDDKSRKKQKI